VITNSKHKLNISVKDTHLGDICSIVISDVSYVMSACQYICQYIISDVCIIYDIPVSS